MYTGPDGLTPDEAVELGYRSAWDHPGEPVPYPVGSPLWAAWTKGQIVARSEQAAEEQADLQTAAQIRARATPVKQWTIRYHQPGMLAELATVKLAESREKAIALVRKKQGPITVTGSDVHDLPTE